MHRKSIFTKEIKLKFLCLALALFMFSTILSADRLVRLYDISRGSVVTLAEEGYDIANVDIRNGYLDIMLPEDEIDRAALLSHDYEVLPREWGELLRENAKGGGYYYDPEENWAFWCSLADNYSDLVDTPVTIGQSYEGRDIYAIEMTSSTTGYKPPIYFSSLIHAREPGGNSVLIDFAMWLTSNYDGGDTRAAYILDNATVYFVPIANPDGYAYNMPGGGNHRKNMNYTLGDGIDLNRNWGYMWGFDNSGSSPYPNDETYRGTAPFSEPETQVQRDFIIDLEPIAAMNYHTYGGDLLYPWGYDDILAPDNALFVGWADAMTAVNNYTYGTAWQVLYNVNGEQNDWCYSGTDVPRIYAMTPEVGDYGFWGSQSDSTQIVRICDECRPMNIFFCIAALDYVGITEGEGLELESMLSLDDVYPNPAVSFTSFRITCQSDQDFVVDIYDTCGRIVHSIDAGSASLSWAIPDEIPAGVYTARISDGAGNFDSRRFTVIK
jgi:murein tripeptide amidase MpaA